MRNLLNNYRRRLANYESVLAYSLLGLVGGIASGLVVLAFEMSIDLLAQLWNVGYRGDGFEALARWQMFALPVAGAAILGVVYSFLKPEDRETGIVHVISRMHSHYGALPLRNAIVQFVGGAFALATGQSGGREGPGVHLGGAINSQLGQTLGLPNNSLRVLIACGTAGGIAAAFSTPLAGVIFAMEVIIAEYTVVGFIPVMLAAVSASAVRGYLAGTGAIFSIPAVSLNSLWEIPYIVLLGLVCGLCVAGFIFISKQTARLAHWPVAVRFTLAGLLTGSLALFVPEILGIGYDTLDMALHGQLAVTTLLLIGLCKLLATSVSCGAGMPIGLIGPSLIIGACVGGAMGVGGHLLFPELTSDPTVYIVLGMAACMAAILNAPLAAVLAVMELTHTISIGMPALLVIIAATLTNTGLLGQRSAHQSVLRQLQRQVPEDSVNQLLHRTDITTCMEISAIKVASTLELAHADPLRKAPPVWCVVERDGEDLYLVKGADLAAWLEQHEGDEPTVDLTAADIRRWTTASAPYQATLRQAMDTMRNKTVEAVCVYGRGRQGKRVLQGVVTQASIENFSLAHI